MNQIKWRVEYENDVGVCDSGYWEWWEITDGGCVFRCDDRAAAGWLCNLLNDNEQRIKDNVAKA